MDGLKSISVVNISTLSDDMLLRESRHKADEMIPFDVVIVVLMLTGIVGNLLVVFYYCRKTPVTPTTTLIITLAVIDTLICVLMPKNIAENEFVYRFTSDVLCKLNVVVTYVNGMASCYILWFIGLFRYRMVCRPFDSQYLMRDSYIAVSLSVLLSVVLTSPGAVFYKSVSDNITVGSNTTLIVYECNTTKDPNLQLYILVMHLVHAIVFCIGAAVLIVCYGLIGRTMWKYNEKRRRLGKTRESFKSSRITKSTNELPKSLHVNVDVISDHDTEMSFVTPATSTVNIVNVSDRSATSIQTENQTSTETVKDRKVVFKTTIMLFVIHAVYVVSFVPYLAISLISLLTTDFDSTPTIFTKLCYRSYLLNSVTNPFIYGLFNMEFRNFVKRCFSHFNLCDLLKRQTFNDTGNT